MSGGKVGVGVGVLIFYKNKILLGLRHSKYDDVLKSGGTWTCPGGKLEYGENFEECAKRELKEETNLDCNDFEVFSLNNDVNEHAHFVTIGVICKNFSGELKTMEPEKISEWKWFSMDDLPENLYMPTKKYLNNFREKKFYIKNN